MNNDIRPAKRPRLNEADSSDDDFPDADLTVEEFDLCLTQATGASKPTNTTTDTGNVSNGLPYVAIKDLSYSLDGQVQLLQRKVASLGKELHDTRLGKLDELKAQADAFAKERHDLKAQIEFKDGELRSCAIRQATLEEKLREKGIETRLKQTVEQATSTGDAPFSSTSKNGSVATKAPERIFTFSKGSNRSAWLSSQYGVHAFQSTASDHNGQAHLDVLRDYASKRTSGDVAQVVPNAVILSLRGLSECIHETLICASSADSSVAERVALSAEKYDEGFVFDVLADLCMVEDSALLAAVVGLLNAFALSSEEACSAILKRPGMLTHLLQRFGEETVTIPILRLLSSLANIDDSLAPFCCSSATVSRCMWKCLCKPFEQHVAVPLLNEGLHFAHQASCTAQSLCPCFAWFVTKISQNIRALQLSSASMRSSNALLSRICAIAQSQPQHRQQACRLLTPGKHSSRLVHVWPFVDEDTANQSPSSDQD